MQYKHLINMENQVDKDENRFDHREGFVNDKRHLFKSLYYTRQGGIKSDNGLKQPRSIDYWPAHKRSFVGSTNDGTKVELIVEARPDVTPRIVSIY